MGITFTNEQQQVIDLRNRNILVSAAAGSGKTAVLVERIITRLTKDEPPIDVDRLLIVTFTEAAASEMKERIHAAIEKALEERPDDAHLQRQATLIHQAQITTIHKFCLSVIRDYFHTIDLDPGFRVAEEGELKLLKRDVVEAVLESAYEESAPEFVNFVESFASGKDDRKLEELILQLYEFSRSYPNPEQWLKTCVKQYDIPSVEALEQSSFVVNVRKEILLYVREMLDLLRCGMRICNEPDGPVVYGNTLHSDVLQLERLLETESFAALQTRLRDIQWDKLVANRDKQVSESKVKQVKAIRDEVKHLIKTLTEQYCFDNLAEMQRDMLSVKEHMVVLTDLVSRFAETFTAEKKRKNLIDFNDMEQYALRILTREENGTLVSSPVAEHYREKFEEIMIDEYQDSNLVQEAILTSVSGMSEGKYNIFMVGDVKQSIYRFRLSRPDLFMRKYHTYSTEDSREQRIDLHKNFRSRQEVLMSTNFVFQQIMISQFGGIDYDEKAALYLGAAYEEVSGNETELLMVNAPDYKAEERMELEAEAIAKRIRELMANHSVTDKKTGAQRPVKYSDIVILTRSLKGWTEVCARVLGSAGIPTYTNSREGYFAAQEVQTILNYLRILDNPRQDIPMAAVLTSMFAGLTSEELALLRSTDMEGTVYDSVCAYLQHGDSNKLKVKLSCFMDTYQRFRDRVPYTAIHELIWKLLSETGYGDYTDALPAGEQRLANLEMLVEKAVTFEGTSYKGLFHFVRYIEQMQKYNVDYGEANLMQEEKDLVSLMSIHKSKGLEFPIVFVAGMGKQFNMQDTRGSIVIHPEMGIGVDCIDANLRTKTPTLLKKIMQQNIQLESAAEELRVLYVAMTRAKEKLILTGSVTNLEKDLLAMTPFSNREELALPYYYLTRVNRYFQWVMAALCRNRCFANVLESCGLEAPYANPYYQAQLPIKVQTVEPAELVLYEAEEAEREELAREILDEWDVTAIYDEDMKAHIEEQFAYQYPHQESGVWKQKYSVSELKKRSMSEDGEQIYPEEIVIPLLPKFLQEQEELSGASRGSAYHKLLEILDFTKEYDEQTLNAELHHIQKAGMMSDEMVACVRVSDILAFLRSDIGRRVQKADQSGTYFAEQPFVLGVDVQKIYPNVELDENVLVQGIIDVYFEEEGELVVLDYKTDRVTEASELIQRYKTQLDYYGEALERLTGKRVKQKLIYSFALRQEMEV